MSRAEYISENVYVVLVYPKYQGNIGAVARSMWNSGLKHLIIVGNKPEDEAFARSMGGRFILENAEIVDDFSCIVSRFNIIAATSSTASNDEKHFRRLPLTPEKFWDEMAGENGKIALVFGREDDGLRNAEIEKCNYFINIPGNPEYPVYNLSHAVAIILYVMFTRFNPPENIEVAAIVPEHEDLMIRDIIQIMRMTSYPEHKIRNTEVLIRRLIARSHMSDREYFRMMGVIRRVKDSLSRVVKDESDH
ncbi:rRNA methyltransferase [Thermoplasma sp. Kam2015]|uniref:RNA methyltransferase n=1 Tax=Thermoplasma sp. Kam2015 TaxID=2094122 RepID=UPI000D92FFC3|nr:RNA methyltransferase [Thermoplasma sp. Kam2015]PYB68068.1 rRNA methyltransferase [Thermoplasma sp. Kam2015]